MGNSGRGNYNDFDPTELTQKLKSTPDPPLKFLQRVARSMRSNSLSSVISFGGGGMTTSIMGGMTTSIMDGYVSNFAIKLGDGKTFELLEIRPKGSLSTTPDRLAYEDYEIKNGKAFYKNKEVKIDLAKESPMYWNDFLETIKILAEMMERITGEDKKADDESKECKICFDNETVCLMTPCGHKFCCITCANKLIDQFNGKKDGLKCPVCNESGTKFVRVFE